MKHSEFEKIIKDMSFEEKRILNIYVRCEGDMQKVDAELRREAKRLCIPSIPDEEFFASSTEEIKKDTVTKEQERETEEYNSQKELLSTVLKKIKEPEKYLNTSLIFKLVYCLNYGGWLIPEDRFEEFLDKADYKTLREAFDNVINEHFSPREKTVFALRYGLDNGHPRTLEEVSQLCGTLRERIRQTEQKILRRFRRKSSYIRQYVDKVLGKPKRQANTKQEKLNLIMEQDLDEIKNCVKVKAYKAAIVLCGSVLETLLSLWLAENDGDDLWIEKDSYYIDEQGRERQVDLFTCIKEMEKIGLPYWGIVEGKQATAIRKKRNLIHAKSIQKPEEEINSDVCNDVCNKLQQLLKKKEKFSYNK